MTGFSLGCTLGGGIDSVLALPARGWPPNGRDSADAVKAAARAIAVVQAVADTSGRLEPSTFRVLRARRATDVATALRIAHDLRGVPVDEPLPACRTRRLVLVPVRLTPVEQY